ncbi:MAG TPA: LysR family transcriptional regulator [Paenalcaligenes sp.]|nr:LysR family transcriptional regulator [Paenalcaligenes sp.]
MNITLRQLRAFVLVAQTKQFTLAAEHMHVTQSALSTLIKELEQRVGVQLLDRHTRMVELTDAGRSFYRTAQKTLNDLQQGVNDLHDLATLRHGRVRVVASTVLSAGLLSPAFKAFRAEFPDVKLVLNDVAEEQIMRTVASGDVDFGIGTSFAMEENLGLNETPLFDDRFIAICSKDHRLASKERMTWADLDGEPFIALAPASPMRKLIDNVIHQQGIHLPISNEVSFATTVLSLVHAGLGLSVLPMNNHPYLPAFEVHAAELEEPVVTRTISIFTQKDKSLSPASAAFMQFLQNFVKNAT